MKILNYREGFASNSSSTHSVWFGEGANRIMESLVDCFEYGWEDFALKSEEEIIHYVMTQYKENLIGGSVITGPNDFMFQYVKAILTAVFGVEPPDDLILYGAVDHQSCWLIPREYGLRDIDIPSPTFTRDIVRYLTKRGNTVIFGGNDNTGRTINPSGMTRNEIVDEIIYRFGGKEVVCRKDGDVWVLFWKNDGRKVRLSFNNNIIYNKSGVPELVDLIISNRCDMNCWYCYRNCTPNGNYSRISNIQSAIISLDNIGVLEIAIGGGDITKHPDIGPICTFVKEYLKTSDIAINTTIGLPNIVDPITTETIKIIIDSFSGVAFSVKTYQDVINVISRYLGDITYKIRDKVSFQIIPELSTGADELESISKLVRNNGFKLVYLGLKETGRATHIDEYRRHSISRMHDSFNSWFNPERWHKIGVDTQFIKNFPQIKEIDKENYDWMLTEHEGKFSCCVDLPNRVMSESSYSGELIDLPVTGPRSSYINEDKFLEIFSKF